MLAQERFWTHVVKGADCWEWQLSCGSHGYGQFYPKKNPPVAAHRYSWELANGPIPTGQHVLHRCDNKRCVRPDHLFLGTPADNIRDMCAKGRHARTSTKGEAQGRAKLNEAAVWDIRENFIPGTRAKPGNAQEFADKYNVARALIYMVVKRKLWRHVLCRPT